MYASFLRISRALHLDIFEQPAENYFFNNLPGMANILSDDMQGHKKAPQSN
jgi:hypothetical protein